MWTTISDTRPAAETDIECDSCGYCIGKDETHREYVGTFEGDHVTTHEHLRCYELSMDVNDIIGDGDGYLLVQWMEDMASEIPDDLMARCKEIMQPTPRAFQGAGVKPFERK